MSKLITIFGCTGNQGGSVVKYILNDAELSKEYRIRGITRDTTKKSAQQLAKKGVELVTVCFTFVFLFPYVDYSVSSLRAVLTKHIAG